MRAKAYMLRKGSWVRVYLPLVSREWRNGVELYLLLRPFFHSLLTKGRLRVEGLRFGA